jgi:hypothetical protein
VITVNGKDAQPREYTYLEGTYTVIDIDLDEGRRSPAGSHSTSAPTTMTSSA